MLVLLFQEQDRIGVFVSLDAAAGTKLINFFFNDVEIEEAQFTGSWACGRDGLPTIGEVDGMNMKQLKHELLGVHRSNGNISSQW